MTAYSVRKYGDDADKQSFRVKDDERPAGRRSVPNYGSHKLANVVVSTQPHFPMSMLR